MSGTRLFVMEDGSVLRVPSDKAPIWEARQKKRGNLYRETTDPDDGLKNEGPEEPIPGVPIVGGDKPLPGETLSGPNTAPRKSEVLAAMEEQAKAEADAAPKYKAKPEQAGILETMGLNAMEGLNFGWGGEIADKFASMAGEAPQRTQGRGIDAPTMTPEQQAAADKASSYQGSVDKSKADRPILAAASEIGGGALATAPLAAFAPLARLATGAGRGARMAAGGLAGAGTGALSGAGQAEEGEKLQGAAQGGLTGGTLGAAFGMLPVNKAASALDDVASTQRAKAAGFTGSKADELIETKGEQIFQKGGSKLEAIPQMGEDIEKYNLQNVDRVKGIHPFGKGEGFGGAVPATAKRYFENAENLEREAISELGAVKANVGGHIDVDLSKVKDGLLDEAAKYSGIDDKAAQDIAAELTDRAQRLQSPKTYGEVLEHRQFLDKLAFKNERQLDSPAAARIRTMAGNLKEAMLKSLEEVSPELRKTVMNANHKYETAKKVQDAALPQITDRGLDNAWSLSGAARQALAPMTRSGLSGGARSARKGLAAFPGALGATQREPEEELEP